MSPFFSIKNLAALEDRFAWALRNLVDEYDRAVQAVPGKQATDKTITVDLYNDAARMAYDIIGTTGFGQDFHLLDPNAKDEPDALRFVKIPYQGTKWFVQRFGLAFFKPVRFTFQFDSIGSSRAWSTSVAMTHSNSTPCETTSRRSNGLLPSLAGGAAGGVVAFIFPVSMHCNRSLLSAAD